MTVSSLGSEKVVMVVVGSESLSLLLRLLRRLLRLRRTKEEAKTTRDKHGCGGNGRVKEEEENISDIKSHVSCTFCAN